MKLKLDDGGHAVLVDGKPVYVHDDGKEVAFDAPATVATITRLNGEAKTHREAKEAAETSLKTFAGITDPAAAIKALDTVKNLDQKKLVDAGEIETVKAEISKAFQSQLDEAKTRADGLETQLYGEKIGGSFARSKFITDKLAVPVPMVESTFGKAFKIEEGKITAYDANGNKIFSRARPGELADFEEAIEVLVEQSPFKDQILKGNNNGGSGKSPNDGGGGKGPAGNFGGSRDERKAAIAAKFPDLANS